MVQLVGSILPSATFVTLVFDGGSLPSKTFTNSRRKQARDASLALAEAYSSAGDSEEAENALKKAISFSNLQVSRIANGVFKRLEKHDNFAVLIAPYEADAQVAYLQKLGMGTSLSLTTQTFCFMVLGRHCTSTTGAQVQVSCLP